MMRMAFENLRYAHVCALLDILVKVRLNSVTYIGRIFSERAEGFDEVVLFLSRLNLISCDDQTLHLRVNSAEIKSHLRRDEIIRRLLGKRNRYRSEVYRFVNHFRVVDSQMIYVPSDHSRSSESGVRNFLIDIGIVTHVMEAEKYVLMAEYASLLASAKDDANHISPILLEEKSKDKHEIGCAAEELIVEFERARVGSRYINMIKHVSIKNCAAGYDIRSVSIKANGSVIPRFIEVKAVTTKAFRFYWSKNEIHVARTLSHWYYLYLLPLDRDGQFNLDSLMVVADPCGTVLSERSNWMTEVDTLICHVKGSASY